jgi:hypothetical protein
MRLPALLVAVIVAGVAGPAAAGPYEDGRTAYEAGDYAYALSFWRPLAEQGDVTAQFNLGGMYDLGQGVPKDYAAAVYWYLKAAGQGHANAQYNLANMYEDGQGVLGDGTVAAAAWYRRAADQGYAPAQANLAAMYINGRGVQRDYVQAYKWLTLALAGFGETESEEYARADQNRALVAIKMAPAQIGEAERLASAWMPRPER